jgi:LacI family transcriptional regulator
MSEQTRREKPTLLDVARHANVSIASVSRVLNNVPPISEKLRAQVEAAVQALGYKTKRSAVSYQPTLVALIGDTHNTYYSEIVAGIQDYADRQDVMVNMILSRPEEDFFDRFLRWIVRSSAVGLVVCGSNSMSEANLKRMQDLGNISVATINCPNKVDGIPTIRIDYERAMGKAVRHVVTLQHTRIAFMNGPERAYSSYAKRLGVEKTLERLGQVPNKKLFVEESATVEGGFQAMHKLFGLPESEWPTAVIASNDLMALGAMHSIRSAGFSIPKDITVVGFDDIEMAAHANPPLTTIAPPKFEMGYKAAQAVLEYQEGDPVQTEEYVVMESPLIVRESSGPCPEAKR